MMPADKVDKHGQRCRRGCIIRPSLARQPELGGMGEQVSSDQELSTVRAVLEAQMAAQKATADKDKEALSTALQRETETSRLTIKVGQLYCASTLLGAEKAACCGRARLSVLTAQQGHAALQKPCLPP